MSDILTITKAEETLNTDSPKVAHIVGAEDQMKGYVDGVPIKALCGVRFIPTRDPQNLPVCEKCLAVLRQVLAARHGNN